ncbi:iron-containing alcohol dehydrogenase [Eubacteriaceae bacterium ES2]|nr:iron-containing alcohol dehydrogenase [Eubacteriaceae bacterium ES2]
MKHSTLELRKFVVPEIIIGTDARLLIGRYIAHFNARKPMLVADHCLQQFGWFKSIKSAILSEAKELILFDGHSSNPKDFEVMMGADLFISEKCDLLVAVGGGSSIDCAKGISIVSANGGNILDYEGVDQVKMPGPPLICIPTTAGSSADVSQFAIIADYYSKSKKAIISKKVVPDLALIDPVPLMTMDPYLTACTGMDALTHAIEAYVSTANSALTDIHAIEAISLLSDHLVASISPDASIETRFQVMLGSLQAGLAFSNASLGGVHALAHSLGGYLDLAHGECNSILLEHLINLNYDSAPERYNKIAALMHIETSSLENEEIRQALATTIATLRNCLDIPDTVQVKDADDHTINSLVENALSDPCMVTNPRPLTAAEVTTVYRRIIDDQNE